MSEPRLTADFFVRAHIRTLAVLDIPAVVVRRGDPTAGQVLVKVNRLGARGEPCCAVYMQSFAMDGRRVWRPATGDALVTEADADAYIARQAGFDPDLWVVEVEDRAGRHLLEPVEGEVQPSA